jgi:hypothetical protein
VKSDIDKAINYLQLYRMGHESGYLFDAKKMINKTLKERKRAQQSANLHEPKRKLSR